GEQALDGRGLSLPGLVEQLLRLGGVRQHDGTLSGGIRGMSQRPAPRVILWPGATREKRGKPAGLPAAVAPGALVFSFDVAPGGEQRVGRGVALKGGGTGTVSGGRDARGTWYGRERRRWVPSLAPPLRISITRCCRHDLASCGGQTLSIPELANHLQPPFHRG